MLTSLLLMISRPLVLFQAILSEEDKIVMIRFGHDWDPTCMKMDETLFSIAEKVKNFAVMYLVDITKVPGESLLKFALIGLFKFVSRALQFLLN